MASFFFDGIKMINYKKAPNKQVFYISLIIMLLLTMLIYSLSINVGEYSDDSVVLFQAYNLEAPFHILQWINLRYIGLKSFFLSSYFGGDTRVVHAISIVIHILNGLLIYFILKKLKFTQWAALVVVAIWLLHPLNSQAVIYMSQRFTLVCSFWLLCSMSVLLCIENKKNILNKSEQLKYLFKLLCFVSASAFFFIFALFSKQTAAFLPLFLVYYLLFFSTYKRFAVIILVIISISFLLVAYFFPFLFEQLDSLTRETETYSRTDYFATQLHVTLIYLIKSIIPIGLSFESSFDVIKFGSIWFYVYLSLHIAFILIIYLAYKFSQDKRLLLGVSFFLLFING